jgi:hypothetical protein
LTRPASAPLGVAGLLFFVSGLSALVYQVTWQRILALHSGVGIYSVAVIVAAFTAGLGLGSLLGGAWSPRLEPVAALRVFAALELGVAAFGALSCRLYYDLLHQQGLALYASARSAGVGHFLALVVPTMLMGMSLPFLVRAMVRETATAARTIGVLYGVNVLGAAAGALVAPWLLMRLLGLRGAVLVAAAGNALVGLGALVAGRRAGGDGVGADPQAAAPSAGEAPSAPAEIHTFGLWLALYALSGFCALSLEILWFRVVDVAVKSAAFTFGTVLCIYLLGSGLGALVGARHAPRLRRPLRAFLICQCLLLALSGAAVWTLAGVPARWTPRLHEYWARYDGITLGRHVAFGGDELALVLTLYLLLPLALYGLPTVLMGLSFPILQRAVHDDARTSGRKVGLLQAANIAGCTAGSLVVGLAGLTWWGTPGSLRALMLIGLVVALVGLRDHGARGRFAALSATLLFLACALPAGDVLWPRLHAAPPERTLVAEDASGLAAIVPEPDGGWRLSVNGKGNGRLPFEGLHAQLGAVPAIVHPAPRAVALIGLGSGATAWAAAVRAETERVDVFEIIAPEERLLRRLLAFEPLPQLRLLAEDARVRVHVADGRNALERGAARYDVIEADALRPQSAYAGNLYSLEFFQACARRLQPGGLVCTWAPTNRVYATFSQALPYVLALDEGRLLVGSREPLRVDLAAWRARLDSPHVAAYLGRELSAEVWRALERGSLGRPKARRREDVNRDPFPRDELLTP